MTEQDDIGAEGDDAPAGYEAMDARKALKVLVIP